MYRSIGIALLLAVQSASAMDFWTGSTYYLRGDFAAALREWRPLAEEGDERAQHYLGLMYARGEGLAVDNSQAAHWFRKSAEQGNPRSQYHLGVLYANGEGVPEDDRQAIHWLGESARQGDAQAQFNLAMMHELGEGVHRDDQQAVNWYQQAAEQGHAGAQYGLGSMLAEGAGIARDDVRAYAWFYLAAARGDEQVRHLANGRLTALLEEMTTPQINEAQRLSAWISDRIDRAAGVKADHPEAGPPGSASPPGAGQDPISPVQATDRQQDTVRQSQVYLAALGFEPGPADGLVGRRTRNAVQSFQRQAGLPPTGRITEELLLLLETAVVERPKERQAATPPPPAEATGSSSGFVVNRAGEILTSHHAVESCAHTGATITFGEASHRATIHAQDVDNDLALLVVDSDESCAWWSPTCAAVFDRPASFSQLPRASLGTEIAVAGFPLRGLLASTLNVTRGNVSAVTGLGNEAKWLQISAPVQHGNSGGPVLDNAGNVIAVVTAKLNAVRTAQETGDVPQNVNFALKGAVVRSFLEIHGIDYSRQPSDEELTPEDLAALADGFTVAVTCQE